MRYGVGKRDGDDYLMVGVDGLILAFNTRQAAEDFSDDLDEEGEWVIVPLPEGEHPVLVVS